MIPERIKRNGAEEKKKRISWSLFLLLLKVRPSSVRYVFIYGGEEEQPQQQQQVRRRNKLMAVKSQSTNERRCYYLIGNDHRNWR